MIAIITGTVMIAIGIGIGFYNYNRTFSPIPQKVEVAHAPAPAVAPTTQTTQTTSKCGEREYTVVKGDTLTGIAVAQWGPKNAFQYQKIWHDNEDKVKNPDLIYPDQILTIKDCIEKDDTPAKEEPANKSFSTTTQLGNEKSATNNVAETVPMPREIMPRLPKQDIVAKEAGAQTSVVMPPPTPEPPMKVATKEKVAPPSEPQTKIVAPEVERLATNLEVEKVSPPLLLPGSAWNSLGTYPIEKENLINQFHAEQALYFAKALGFNVGPFASLDLVKDSKQYQWDNRTRVAVGLRFQRPFSHGVLNTSFAYAFEQRRKLEKNPSRNEDAFVFSNDGWFGYSQPTPNSKGKLFRGTPGTIWWTAGNISPFEKGNWIILARGEQGISLAKAGNTYFIPLGWAQAGYDTKGYSWNRRLTTGGGMQVRFPWNTGVIGVTGGYECTRTLVGSSASTCGPTVKMDIWTGWLAHTKGGK